MIKLIIFDLDNTLTDFVKMKDVAIEAAIEAMIDAGLMYPPQKIRKEIYGIYKEEGIEYQKVFNKLLVNLIGEVDYKILAAGIVAYRRAREAALVLYPHVKVTLIQLLSRGLKLAVISDAPRQEAWLRLCYLQLHHMFDVVLTYEDTGEYKPSPAPFRKVLDRMGIEPDEALMVGDWPERDIVGAAELGIKTIFARYGDTFGTKESGADYEVKDAYELVGIVDELNRPREPGRDREHDPVRGEGHRKGCGSGRGRGHGTGRGAGHNRKPLRKGSQQCTS